MTQHHRTPRPDRTFSDTDELTPMASPVHQDVERALHHSQRELEEGTSAFDLAKIPGKRISMPAAMLYTILSIAITGAIAGTVAYMSVMAQFKAIADMASEAVQKIEAVQKDVLDVKSRMSRIEVHLQDLGTQRLSNLKNQYEDALP